MSAKHTPGPWFVKPGDEWTLPDGGHIQWGSFDISAGSADRHADNYYRIGSVSNVNDLECNQANARVIAESPALLFDLLSACNYIDALGGDSKRYRVTIAKATGGAA